MRCSSFLRRICYNVSGSCHGQPPRFKDMTWQSLSRSLSTVPVVGAFHFGYVDGVGGVPAFAAQFAGGGVVGVPAPGGDGGLVPEVGDGDAEAVRGAGGG